MRQGFEPCRGNFSNAVTACDFWSNGFVFSRLPRRVECSPVLPSPLESTPVVERIRRAAGGVLPVIQRSSKLHYLTQHQPLNT